MVGPPPPSPDDPAAAKTALREELRVERKAHFASLPDNVRALMFSRPPTPLVERIGADAVIGLYRAVGAEAPTGGYARWFHDRGYRLALPWFAAKDAPMEFRGWSDPYDDDALERRPLRIPQPPASADPVTPDVCIVPLLAFTAAGIRLGQGGGHYDRWLAANPGTMAVGLAWDCQLREDLPVEPHDVPLAMVVTATRAYEAGR